MPEISSLKGSCLLRCDIRTLPAQFVSKVRCRTLAADAITCNRTLAADALTCNRTLAADAITCNRTTENTETTQLQRPLTWTSQLYCLFDGAHFLLLKESD